MDRHGTDISFEKSEMALVSGIIKRKQGKGKKVVQVITNLTKWGKNKNKVVNGI